MLAILERELRAFFISPVAYVFLAVFYAISGYYFWGFQLMSGSGDFSGLFYAMFSVAVFITPLLTMRVLSEERRHRTDQALITAPVSLASIVTGKYLATVVVFLTGELVMLLYLWVVASHTTVEYGVFFGSYIGLLLLGMSLCAIGVFVSSLTESQIIAAVVSTGIGLALYLLDSLTYVTNNPTVSDIVSHISFYSRYQGFGTGLLDPSDILFFVSVIVLFNFLTARTLEKRRWS